MSMDRKKHTIHLVQQVLKVRAWSEESAKGALNDANAELDSRLAAREVIETRITGNLAALRLAHGQAGTALDLDQIQRLRQWQGDSEAEMEKAGAAVDAAQQVADDAREALGGIVAERRALGAMKDRLQHELRSDDARVQGRLADEAYAANASHRAGEPHGTH